MSRDRYNYHVSRTQARPATQRMIVVLLVITGITLLVLAKAQHPMVLQLRMRMLDLMRPAMSAISQPVTATRKLATQTGEVLDTAEENRRLLQRAIALQSRVIETIAGAALPRAQPVTYGESGLQALPRQTPPLTFAARA